MQFDDQLCTGQQKLERDGCGTTNNFTENCTKLLFTALSASYLVSAMMKRVTRNKKTPTSILLDCIQKNIPILIFPSED